MPELPDINLYVEKIDERVREQVLNDIRVSKPFLVRSFDPPLSAANGKQITELRRVGKRIVIGLRVPLITCRGRAVGLLHDWQGGYAKTVSRYSKRV